MRKLDKNQILAKKVEPPIKPSLTNDVLDPSNFRHFNKEQMQEPPIDLDIVEDLLK